MSDNQKKPTNDVLIPIPQNNLHFSDAENSLPVPVNTGEKQVVRDDSGKFVSGVSPNPKGRPKGARNKFTENFMRTLAEDFKANGMDALEQLRKTSPEAYLRCIISILPKSLIRQWEESPDVNYSEITEEEFMELINEIQRQKHMEKAVESVSK